MTKPLTRQQRRLLQRNAEAIGLAAEGDRRFFARHPSRTYRVRILSRAERAQMEAFQGGTFNLTPEAPVAFAALKQLVPGFRLKVVVFGPAETVGEELTEAEAEFVFEGYADGHPSLRQREAMLRATARPADNPPRDGGPTA